MNRRQTRFIRKVLYTLKREYGFDITFHKMTGQTLDLEDGTSTQTFEIKRIKRAIVLPDSKRDTFEYDLAFIAAAKNFTYGGSYTTSLRRIIIDRQDLGDYTIELRDYIIWNEKRWEVAKIDSYELETGFIVQIRLVEGVVRYQITEMDLESAVVFSGTQSYTVE